MIIVISRSTNSALVRSYMSVHVAYLTIFIEVRQHNNLPTILLPDHPRKIIDTVHLSGLIFGVKYQQVDLSQVCSNNAPWVKMVQPRGSHVLYSII